RRGPRGDRPRRAGRAPHRPGGPARAGRRDRRYPGGTRHRRNRQIRQLGRHREQSRAQRFLPRGCEEAMTSVSEPHPVTAQPVGLPVDATPAQRPSPVTLEGRYGRLERLPQPPDTSLWKAAQGQDHIWTYMSYGPLADFAAFSAWLAGRVKLEDPYSYAIIDPSGQTLGIATLMEIRPAMRVIEVGNILYSPALQRTPLGT